MRAALLIAVLVAVGLSAALAVRTWRRHPDAPPVEHCDARAASPPPLLPELAGVPLFVNAAGVALRVDGSPAPARLTPGVHQLEASAPEVRGAALQLTVPAMSAVLLDARVVDGAVTVLVLGARCTSCEPARTDVDLRFSPRALGSGRDAAIALASGAWAKAAESLRAVADDDRDARFTWLHGVLLALAGQPSKATEVLRKLPAGDAFHAEHARWSASTTTLPEQLLANATPRWNATVERFERLTDEFSGDAPEVVTQLTQRFAALSDRLNAGLTAHDAVETETALDDATTELTKAVTALQQRRADCAWQQRITRTF